jgi:ligand-binding sensor domain-containing protein
MKQIIILFSSLLLHILPGKTQTISTAHWADNNPYGHIFRSGFKDKSGNLWFGTTGAGVFRYDGKSFTNLTTKDGLNNNWVYAITEDKSGNIWFGTEDGACSFNGKSFSRIPVIQLFGKKAPIVYSLMCDSAGNIWIGTDNATAYRFDGKAFTNVLSSPKEKGVHPAPIQSIYEDKKGNIWIASMSHGGLLKYDGKSWISYTMNDGLADGHIFSIAEDRKGNIWFGGSDHGLSRYDGKAFTNFNSTNGLCENNTTSILEDKQGNLWFSSDIINASFGGGICRYDGKSFRSFTTKDGITNNGYWTILEDNAGQVWVGGRNGSLRRYDGKSFIDMVANGRK